MMPAHAVLMLTPVTKLMHLTTARKPAGTVYSTTGVLELNEPTEKKRVE